MSNLTSIDFPEKIGIGGVDAAGMSRLLEDIATVDAQWFYTWSSALPDLELEDWLIGDDLAITDDILDRSLRLGETGNAWILQSARITGGATYDFTMNVSGSAGDRGGITIDFLDENGNRVGGAWTPMNGAMGNVTLPDLHAPITAKVAKIVAWGEAGALELDDLALESDDFDAIANGGFENVNAAKVDNRSFVPMIWGAGNASARTLNDLNNVEVLLGFNEPDHRLQSDLSVADAIRLWPGLMETGARLASPATTTAQTLGDASWLGRFIAEADAQDLRVDVIAVHYYSANRNVEAFKAFLERVHDAYDRPVWVTEWALVDWQDMNRFSFEETSQFLHDATLMMDDLDFVERHAWFGMYDGMDGLSMNTHLFDETGDLTLVGHAFADFAPDRIVHAGQDGETVQGGAGDDNLIGGGGSNSLFAGLGDDVMTGGAGADRFHLGEVDRLNFGYDTITDFDFTGADADTLIFTFDGEDHLLLAAEDFGAFASKLLDDDVDATSALIEGDNLVLTFGADRGSITLALRGVKMEAGTTETVPDAPEVVEPSASVEGFLASYFVLDKAPNDLSEIDFSARPTVIEAIDQIKFTKENSRVPFWEGGVQDNFAAKMIGNLAVENAGMYTFWLRSDDGSEMSVAGQVLINNDGLHAEKTKSASIYLETGSVPLEVLYFEKYGDQVLGLEWSGPDTLGRRETIDAAHVSHEISETATEGFLATFFALEPGVTNLDAIDFGGSPEEIEAIHRVAFGLGNGTEPFWNGGAQDNFAAKIVGDIEVAKSGSYTFWLTSDDGSKMSLNNEIIMDNDGLHAARTRSVTLDLEAGPIPLEILYFEKTGLQVLGVEWSGPDTGDTRQILDGSHVSHTVLSYTFDGCEVPVVIDEFIYTETREERTYDSDIVASKDMVSFSAVIESLEHHLTEPAITIEIDDTFLEWNNLI